MTDWYVQVKNTLSRVKKLTNLKLKINAKSSSSCYVHLMLFCKININPAFRSLESYKRNFDLYSSQVVFVFSVGLPHFLLLLHIVSALLAALLILSNTDDSATHTSHFLFSPVFFKFTSRPTIFSYLPRVFFFLQHQCVWELFLQCFWSKLMKEGIKIWNSEFREMYVNVLSAPFIRVQ